MEASSSQEKVLEGNPPKKAKIELSTKVIVLIRHGDYKEQEEESNKTLTPCGRQQALNASRALQKIPDLPPIRKIITSTMVRAIGTCEIIANEIPELLPFSHDKSLEEGDPTLQCHLRRFEHVYRDYFVPVQGPHTQAEVLVTHGNLIRYLVCR